MTNDLTEAIDLTSVHQEHAIDHAPQDPPRRGRGRRLAVALAAGVVAVGVGAALAVGGSGGSAPTSAREHGAAEASPLAAAPTTVPGDPASSSGDPASSSDGEAGPAQPDPTQPDPAPPAEPGHLVVGTTYHGLATNDFSGSFEVTNDGGSDVEWSWNGDVLVAVSQEGGVLAPGESVVVEFTVAWQQLPNGAFLYVSSVDSADQSIVVTIAGNRDIAVNPDIELPEPELVILED